jgi:glycosyltransferase involved in cell wall biosynthesis
MIVVPGRQYGEERKSIGQLARRIGAEVIHTHGYRPDVVDAPVGRAVGLPIVSTVHGFTGGGMRNRIYERLQLFRLRRFDGVVAVSRPIAKKLVTSGVRPDRVHCIPNAWLGGGVTLPAAEARRVLDLDATKRWIGWVGRISHEKGLDVMIEALAILDDPTVALVVMGRGPEEQAVRARAQQLGISARIKWCGVVENAERYFAAFDVFVLSSRTEGTPMVLLEAMSYQLPIVATAVGGIPDVLDREQALLVERANPAALASAIASVFSDPAASRQRAQKAQARLTAFAPEPWLRSYESLYRQLASRPG